MQWQTGGQASAVHRRRAPGAPRMLCGRTIPQQALVLDIPDEHFDGDELAECERCRAIVEGASQAAVVQTVGDTPTLRAMWRLGRPSRPAEILAEAAVGNVSLQRFMPVLRGHELDGRIMRLADGRFNLTPAGVREAAARAWEREQHQRIIDDPQRAQWERDQHRRHLHELDRYEPDRWPLT